MRILLVEDSASFAGDIVPILLEQEGVSQVEVARDKETAIGMLENGIFDLVILDLSILPSPDLDVAEPEHGQTVFHEARKLSPGMPIFILTGSEPDKFTRSLARFGNQVELWGDRTPVETVSYFLKEEAHELVDRVRIMAASLSKTTGIEINTRGIELGLTQADLKMLRAFTRRADGVACDVAGLSGGLSDAKVVKATAFDSGRRPQVICAGKLGKNAGIAAEQEAFERHVKKLGVGAYPNVYCYVDSGVGQNGAIFYTLTDEDTVSFFERLVSAPLIGPEVVARARASLRRWTDAATTETVSIDDMRARLLDDEALSAVAALNDISSYNELSSITLQASTSCIHGDFHAGNILTKQNGEAIVIDFGDAGPGFSCADPIALELSLVFHPDARKHGTRDALIERLEYWPDLKNYAGEEPLSATVAACREWAHDVGGGDLAVLAQAYVFSLRQLKYDTVDARTTERILRVLEREIRKRK